MTTRELLALFHEDEKAKEFMSTHGIEVCEGSPREGCYVFFILKNCSCGREGYARADVDKGLLQFSVESGAIAARVVLSEISMFVEALENHIATCDHKSRRGGEW